MSYGVVRIRAELLPEIDKVVKNVKNKFGIKRFKSRQEVVTKAVEDFLRGLDGSL